MFTFRRKKKTTQPLRADKVIKTSLKKSRNLSYPVFIIVFLIKHRKQRILYLTKELIETWSLLNFKKQLSNFGETPIWYNSLIRIDNKPIHYRNWSTAGIYFVNDLLEEDSQFLTFDTFREKFAIKAHFLQYHGVICAISNIKRKNHCPQMNGAKTDTRSLLSSEAFCKIK